MTKESVTEHVKARRCLEEAVCLSKVYNPAGRVRKDRSLDASRILAGPGTHLLGKWTQDCMTGPGM